MANQQLSTNTFGVSKWIVSADATQGTHTTWTAATAAASSGDTIWGRDGTYTENFTAKAGVTYTAATGDSNGPNVTIIGKITCSGIGTYTFSNIQLETNSDYCLAVTGSAATVVYLNNCFINVLNNTAIDLASSNASSSISLYNCLGNIATTGIAIFAHSGGGSLVFVYSFIYNLGSSTTASTVSGSGSVFINWSEILSVISVSSTANFSAFHSYFAGANTTCLTLAGSGTSSSTECSFNSGTASAISVGAGHTYTLLGGNVSSSNTNAITGAGTIQYGGVIFSGSSSTVNTTTQTEYPWTVKQGGTGISSATAYGVVCGGATTTGALQVVTPDASTTKVFTCGGSSALPTWQANSGVGNLVLIQKQTASTSSSLAFTTGITTYNNLFLIFYNVVSSGSNVNLEIQLSTNAGVSYLTTGYLSGFNFNTYNSATTSNQNSTTAFIIDRSGGTSDILSGFVYIQNINGSSQVQVNGESIWTNGSSCVFNTVFGTRVTTGTNALQVLFTTGTITSGNFDLYGIL